MSKNFKINVEWEKSISQKDKNSRKEFYKVQNMQLKKKKLVNEEHQIQCGQEGEKRKGVGLGTNT